MAYLRAIRSVLMTSHSNLRWFIANNPPLVLFTVCVMLFFLILMTLGYYVKVHEQINNPDESQDWNVFLESFSKVEFCTGQHPNISSSLLQRGLNAQKPHWWPIATNPKVDQGKRIRTFTLTMASTIRPNRDFVSKPRQVTHLSASMRGKYIGLKGDAGVEKLNVSIMIPYSWNSSLCSESSLQGCTAVTTNVCVEFRGPEEMFPIEASPKACTKTLHRGTEYWADMDWQILDIDSLNYCRSKTMINVAYKFDPKLSTQLKQKLRALSKSHLFHTCYFLFVFVSLVFGYAAVVNHTMSTAHNPGDVFHV